MTAKIFHFITSGLLPKLPPVERLPRRVPLASLGPPCEDAIIADIRKKKKKIKPGVHCVLSRIADKHFAAAGTTTTLFGRAGLQLQPTV